MDAQELDGRLFRGGVVLGFNASQLDGDQYRGYDKLGLHAGLKVRYTPPGREKLGIHVEMLYSMRGSNDQLIQNSSSNTQSKIKLDYIAVPFVVSYREWNIDFHVGASYGRLIHSSTNIFTIYAPEDFRQNEVNVLLGATYVFKRNWGATFRFSRSVTNAVLKEVNKDPLLGHWLTFRIEYFF